VPRVLAVLLLVLVAGCSAGPAAGGLGPVGPTTRSPTSAAVFDCGRVDVRRLSAAQRPTRLEMADGCLRNALLDGQPARLVRVFEDGRTTYVVTGRGQLAITQEAGGGSRLRRCTHATGLFELGTCTRDPGSGR
jgi:hypothetical protein